MTLHQLASAIGDAEAARMNRRPIGTPSEAEYPGLDRLTEAARQVLGIEPPLRWADESIGAIEARLRRIGLDPAATEVEEAAEAIERSRNLGPLVCQAGNHDMADSEYGFLACYGCRHAHDRRYRESMAALFIVPKILVGDPRYTLSVLLGRMDADLRDFAIERFGHETFSFHTLEKLRRWLRVHRGLSEEQVGRLPQAEVAEMLRADLAQASATPVEATIPTLSPVIASRRMLNVALGGSESSKTLLETLQKKGELSFTKSGVGNHSVLRVTMADPDEHRRLRDYVARRKGRNGPIGVP